MRTFTAASNPLRFTHPTPISHFGKIIRIDTKTIRSAGRAASGVRLDTDDKVAAAMPPEDPQQIQPESGTLLQ